jgi:glycosyltransferase involved in cell wall biosynthesis
LHIIYIGTLPPHRGGSAMVAAQLLPGLMDLNHAVTALAPRSQDAPMEPSEAPAGGIRVIRFPMPYDETNTAHPPPEAYRRLQTDHVHACLAELIGKRRPDLILIGREGFVWGIRELAARAAIPCAVLCHGTILYLLSGMYPEPLGSRFLAELRKADLIICCARHMAARMADAGFSSPLAISNGIDTVRFRPTAKDPSLLRSLGLDENAVVALHASNLKDVKRFVDLADAAALLGERCPELRHLIVGDGPERPAAEAACRERGLADRFRFAGWVDPGRMPEFLALGDMLIMPSASEGMSLACLEAMACGRLVIASAIPGARELIADGATGLLFGTGDVEELAAKMLVAARDPELRARLGRAARAHVERHHRRDDMVARYAAALEELAERCGCARPSAAPVPPRRGRRQITG